MNSWVGRDEGLEIRCTFYTHMLIFYFTNTGLCAQLLRLAKAEKYYDKIHLCTTHTMYGDLRRFIEFPERFSWIDEIPYGPFLHNINKDVDIYCPDWDYAGAPSYQKNIDFVDNFGKLPEPTDDEYRKFCSELKLKTTHSISSQNYNCISVRLGLQPHFKTEKNIRKFFEHFPIDEEVFIMCDSARVVDDIPPGYKYFHIIPEIQEGFSAGEGPGWKTYRQFSQNERDLMTQKFINEIDIASRSKIMVADFRNLSSLFVYFIHKHKCIELTVNEFLGGN